MLRGTVSLEELSCLLESGGDYHGIAVTFIEWWCLMKCDGEH